ncbi:hypothetical protein MLD38_005500 [Melastoma candidum]|uniref:Uncharacterized protein n=1 Tax=Melastoma candidum TaxID=119954 RepID=A0ACB9RJK2_9MYRT|nr:hypothetical protein MLD38_005500 [Melastoma candidum]
MASLKAEKPAGSGTQLPGQAKQDPPKAAATPKAPATAPKLATPKKADPKPTSQPKKKAPTAGRSRPCRWIRMVVVLEGWFGELPMKGFSNLNDRGFSIIKKRVFEKKKINGGGL